MIRLQESRFVNAALKARQVKLYVRMFAWRQYQARTPQGHVYTVRFESRASGTYAHCNCAGGSKSLACYHVAAGFPVDVAVTTMRLEHVRQAEAAFKASHKVQDVLRYSQPQPPRLGRIGGIEL